MGAALLASPVLAVEQVWREYDISPYTSRGAMQGASVRRHSTGRSVERLQTPEREIYEDL